MIDQYLKPNVKRGVIYDLAISLVLGILSIIPFLNCIVWPITCVVGLLLPFAIGWLVAQWGRVMPSTPTPLSVTSTSPYATPAVDGAVAAGVGQFISGLIVLILNLLFGSLFATLGAVSSGEAGRTAVGLVAGAAGGVVSLIVLTIVAAVAGAIGGALYIVYTSRQSPAM